MKRVKFTKDFATKRIGDVCEYDGQHAHQLVNVDKVAEYTTEAITTPVEGREHIEVSSEVEYKPADAVVEKKAEGDGMDLDLDNHENEDPENQETETDTDPETETDENKEVSEETETETETDTDSEDNDDDDNGDGVLDLPNEDAKSSENVPSAANGNNSDAVVEKKAGRKPKATK